MKIVDRKMLAPNVHELTLEAPGIAQKARAGQFAIAIPNRFSERTPLTLADWDAERGLVSVVFLEIGDATADLAALQKGDEMYSFTGPLGRPFAVEDFGRVGLVGGCYGIGAILPAARALRAAANEVVAFVEARSSFLLYWQEKLADAAHELRYATADGSQGRKGHAHDLLAENLAAGEAFDRIIAVGCTYMMFCISRVTRPYGIKTIVSMNPIMIDGTGMCGACRLPVGGKTRFACVDGPHFDGHEVDWEVVLARRQAYLEEEIVAQER